MHYRVYLLLALLGILHPVKTERNIVDGRQYRCELSQRSTFSEDRPYVFKDSRKLYPELVIQRNGRSQFSSRFRDQTEIRFLQRNIRENLQSRAYNDRLIFSRNTNRNVLQRIHKDFHISNERHNLVSKTRQVINPSESAYGRSVSERRVNQRYVDRRQEYIRSQSENTDRLRQNERHTSRQRSLDRSISTERVESNRIINLNAENRLSLDMNHARRQIAERRTVSQLKRVDMSSNPRTNELGEDLLRDRYADQRRNVIENRRVVLKRESSVRLIPNHGRETREQRRVQRNINNNERRQIWERRSVSQVSRQDVSRNPMTHQSYDDLRGERQLDQRRNDMGKQNVLRRESRLRQTELRLSQLNDLRRERSFILQRRERYWKEERVRDIVFASKRIERRDMRSADKSKNIAKNTDTERSLILRRERTALRDINDSQDLQKRRLSIRREVKAYSVQVRHMERDTLGRRVRDNNAQTYRMDDARDTERRNNERQAAKITRERIEYGINRGRDSRSELARNSQVVYRDASRDAVLRERISRENAEHTLRYDPSRNVLSLIKNNDSHSSQWQILIFSIQGIYLCSILFKIFDKRESSIQKNRSFGWFTIANPMKLD